MTITSFQLVDNQTFLPADIVNGTIFTSADQVNGAGVDLSTGIRVTIDYHDLQSIPRGARLQALVEGKSSSGQYYVLAYQFEEFLEVGFEQKAQIIMAPDLNWPDAGIDNIIFVGGSSIEKVSNQVGILPGTWRVRVNIRDPNNDFVSIRMSIYGERFNALTFPDKIRSLKVGFPVGLKS